MCGRFSLFERIKQIEEHYQLLLGNTLENEITNWQPQYNIAPGNNTPIIINEEIPKLVLAHWGLLPNWPAGIKNSFKMINARAETIEEKTSYKKAFETQRCLIPFSNFFEWKKTTKTKKPYFIGLKSQKIGSFAGIWEKSIIEEKETTSYSIITTRPNSLMEKIHDRMPVILPYEKEKQWIDQRTSKSEAKELLLPFSAEKMTFFEISKAVNRPENNSAKILLPLSNSQRKLF